MKKLVSFLLLFVLSFQLIAKTVWCITFELNRSFFIEQFCENADRPELNCRARCYLKKQAEAEHKQANKLPGFIKEKQNEQLAPCIFVAFAWQKSAVKHISQYTCNYAFTRIPSVFQPPPVK